MAGAGGFGIFSGAGISAAPPAAMPVGDGLRNLILKDCFQATESITPGIVTSELRSHLLYESGWKLEYVMARLAGTVGTDAIEVIHALRIGIPNDAHLRF